MGGKGERVMTVLARQQLSRTSSVTVLRVMDRALVLGVTEQGVQLITETELSPIEDALAIDPDTGRNWARKRVFPAGVPAEVGAEDSQPGLAIRPVGRRQARTALDGSVLSSKTWRQLVGAARELTVRR
jgi:flagellar protein FliO/FliZ